MARRGDAATGIRTGDRLTADLDTGFVQLQRSMRFCPGHLRSLIGDVLEPIAVRRAA